MLEEISDAFCGGIHLDIPGHGGHECAAFLPRTQMVLETLLATVLMEPRLKRFLLVLLCLVFGVEIGYKLCSRSALYLLNPCHVTTMFQIYLLASKPSQLSFSILRVMMHYVYGAAIAILFPDTLARFFPGEVLNYWLQHLLIFFVVPPYLVYIWGPQCLEPFREWSWNVFAGIFFGIQHLYVMTPLALITHVNLNYVMCPAYVDPFRGPYYRTYAVIHQALCLLILGKLYTFLVKLFVGLLPSPHMSGKKSS
ncbi:hypothetical protein EMCRGX_G026125 [Ephydatia muelleri]